MEQFNIFGGIDHIEDVNQDPNRTKTGAFINNPIHKVYGITEGKKCKECKHLYRRKFANTYIKCALRGEPKASPANDHKANWPACGKFEMIE